MESTGSKVGLAILGHRIANLTMEFCSLALALSLSQSLLDQSDWFGKGCGTCCLQNEHVAPNCSHAFWGIQFIMLILFSSVGSVPNVLTQLVLIGLKQWL